MIPTDPDRADRPRPRHPPDRCRVRDRPTRLQRHARSASGDHRPPGRRRRRGRHGPLGRRGRAGRRDPRRRPQRRGAFDPRWRLRHRSRGHALRQRRPARPDRRGGGRLPTHGPRCRLVRVRPGRPVGHLLRHRHRRAHARWRHQLHPLVGRVHLRRADRRPARHGGRPDRRGRRGARARPPVGAARRRRQLRRRHAIPLSGDPGRGDPGRVTALPGTDPGRGGGGGDRARSATGPTSSRPSSCSSARRARPSSSCGSG